MREWQLNEILQAVGARRPEDWQAGEHFAGVFTDTRRIVPGGVFVPLSGEKFDGHNFAGLALQGGAAAVLWARGEVPEDLRGRVLRVADTLDAYQALGSFNCLQLGLPVVAITGSVGKTTTKDLVKSLLSSRLKVHATPVNHNNDVGVANTLLELTPQHQVAIVEMGMRGSGQIRRLARLVRAKVGIITAIGESHLEILGTREAIAAAKAELFEEMDSAGTAIYPGDSPYAAILRERIKGRGVSFATQPHAQGDWQLLEQRPEVSERGLGSRVRLAYPGGQIELSYSRPGLHNASNLLAALAACAELGLSPEELRLAIAEFQPTGMRAEVQQLSRGITLINDAYNAAPSSVRGGLEVMEQLAHLHGERALEQPRRRVAVLGDMLELGDDSPRFHSQIGEECARLGINVLVTVGDLSANFMAPAAKRGGVECHCAADREEAWKILPQLLEPGDVVLLKASHSIGLELLAQNLQEMYK